MEKRLFKFFVLFFLISVGLIVRTCYLGSSQALAEVAQKQQNYNLRVSKERGVIYDRSLKLMTNSTASYKAVVSPNISVVEDLVKMGCTLERDQILKEVSSGKPFVVNVKNPNTDNANIKTVETTDRYAKNSIAPHILGYLNSDGDGVSGIEKAYDSFLKENSHSLQAVCALDGKRNFLEGKEIDLKADGNSSAGVALSLDANAQSLVEHACSDIKKGAAILLDAQSSDILAMASFPSFSPISPASSVKDEENSPMINRALSPFVVGSDFKIVTAAAAIDGGLSNSLTYTCEGKVDVDGKTYRCHHRSGHGDLDMCSAFVESCNPYFINLGAKVGAKAMRSQATSLGFGREINLAKGITSSAGTLPPLDMSSGELANFSFGQGDLTATPLQVAQMVSSVVNGGKVLTPRLVVGTTNDGQTVDEIPQGASIQAMSEKASTQIRDFMIKTVEGTVARPNLCSAGGKSGTAQTGKKTTDGKEEYQTWYAGFFPADKPKYIAVVLLEGGSSGTNDTGPIFAKIADSITSLDISRGS